MFAFFPLFTFAECLSVFESEGQHSLLSNSDANTCERMDETALPPLPSSLCEGEGGRNVESSSSSSLPMAASQRKEVGEEKGGV